MNLKLCRVLKNLPGGLESWEGADLRWGGWWGPPPSTGISMVIGIGIGVGIGVGIAIGIGIGIGIDIGIGGGISIQFRVL